MQDYRSILQFTTSMSRHSPPQIFALLLCSLTLVVSAPNVSAKERARPAAVQRDSEAELVAYGQREDVMRFADEIAERHSLAPDAVKAALAQARFVPSVARLIMPPPNATAKNWADYRSRFVEPGRIHAGVEFWRANTVWLKLAEEVYGVPPEIVVGIIGVETLYGQQTGNFRVIDALATLAFDFPTGRSNRAPFFRDELASYFVLCRSEGIDPLALRGSFAGAMGLPQFMPSSFNKYAVDMDGDGRVDLHGSAADVIGSIAHYLAEFGWQRDLPTHFSVEAPADDAQRATLLGPDIVPSFSAQELAEGGAVLDERARLTTMPELKFALVELQNGGAAPSYVAGTLNFYVITRYNRSSYYAMAVVELGQAVAHAARVAELDR